MAHVVKQIIGSFEDIGKDIARETVKVPKDVVGKALESLGTGMVKGQKGNPMMGAKTSSGKPEGALGQLEQTKDQKSRQSIAREALSQLAGNQKRKEPTVQERFEKDKQEKNEKESKQAAVQQKMAPLARISTKQRRGMLNGNPQSSSEKSKNARQD